MVKTESWRNMFFGWAVFLTVLCLFFAGFMYAILFTNEPLFIKGALTLGSLLMLAPIYACAFVYMPDARKEWKK